MTSEPSGAADHPTDSQPSVAQRVMRGGVAAAIGEAGNRFIAVGSTFVLAGILGPFDFGVMSAALLASSTIDLVFTTGLGPAVQMHQRHGEMFDRTALTFGLALGLTVTCLVILVADPLASLVGVPTAAQPIKAIAIVTPLGRWADVRRGMTLRELSFGVTATISVSAGLLGAIVAVILALTGFGYWSLVWQYVVVQTATAILFTSFGPGTRRPGWERSAARILVRHSREFLVNAVLVFAYNNLDDAAVSRTSGAEALGAYSLGYRIASLPATVFASALHQVTLPAYIHGDEPTIADQRALYERALRLSIVVGGSLAGAIAFFGPPALELVYHGRWEQAYGVVRWLAVFGAMRAIGGVAGTVFYALDRLPLVRRVSGLQAGVIAIASWPAASWAGPNGVAAVVAVAFTLSAVGAHALAAGLLKPGARPAWPVWRVRRAVIPPLASAVVSIGFALPDPTWPKLALGLTVHFGAALIATRWALPTDVSEVRRYVKGDVRERD